MNGTVAFGVGLIIMALVLGWKWFIALLIAGVVIAAFGSFATTKRPAATERLPADDDSFV